MARGSSSGTTKRPSKGKQPTKTKTPSKTAKPTEGNASGHASDTLEQLRTTLPLVYMTLAWTHLDAGGQLNAYIIDSYLPSRALELAQSCGLISASEAVFVIPTSEPVGSAPVLPDGAIGPDEAAIGLWCVTKPFKADFMRLLEKPIDSLRSTAATEQALRTNPTAIQWRTPTPAQHIKRFLNLTHWSQNTLIKKVSGDDEYVCETTKQFLKRLCRRPETAPQARIDSRTYNRLERLLAIMSTNAPQQFGSLRIEDLRWTSIDFNA
jgi:hypothetical protein